MLGVEEDFSAAAKRLAEVVWGFGSLGGDTFAPDNPPVAGEDEGSDLPGEIIDGAAFGVPVFDGVAFSSKRPLVDRALGPSLLKALSFSSKAVLVVSKVLFEDPDPPDSAVCLDVSCDARLSDVLPESSTVNIALEDP